MKESPSTVKDPGVFGYIHRLLGYVMDGKSPNRATHISTTQQAVIQKNITYNQCGDDKRDSSQERTIHRGWVAAGALGVVACVAVADRTGILPVSDYFRRSDSSKAQACDDSPVSTEDCAGSSDKKACADSPDNKAGEPGNKAGEPDNKAGEPDNKDAEDDQPKDTPQDPESDSDRSVYTKHQVYEHHSSERRTAKGYTVREEFTHFTASVRTTHQQRPHEAQAPKKASPATGQDHASQQAERQALSRSIMDKINAGGRRAGV